MQRFGEEREPFGFVARFARELAAVRGGTREQCCGAACVAGEARPAFRRKLGSSVHEFRQPAQCRKISAGEGFAASSSGVKTR